jgi:hypothetical protein
LDRYEKELPLLIKQAAAEKERNRQRLLKYAQELPPECLRDCYSEVDWQLLGLSKAELRELSDAELKRRLDSWVRSAPPAKNAKPREVGAVIGETIEEAR